MAERLLTLEEPLDKFPLEEIIQRMPQLYRKKLRQRITPMLKSGRQIVIYCDGVFDLFHFGHIRLLEQCKTMFPNVKLIVGISSDEEIEKHKGKHVSNILANK